MIMRSNRNFKRDFSKQRGFTLIELLVVIVILGLLAALVGPRLFPKVEKAKLQSAKTQIELFGTALDSYRLDIGKYPDNMDALVTDDGNESWDGPYLKKSQIPKDPWNHEYHYQVEENGKSYKLSSDGDGTKQITSWE
jgi:general secretion pathway protein G